MKRVDRSFLISFVRTIAAWFLLLTILYPLVIFYAGSHFPQKIKQTKGGNGHMWSRLREADSTTHADVLVVGSSIAYRGVDPRSFDTLGLRLFNLGSSAQTPMQSAYLIEKYWSRFKPAWVIWDVNFNTFQNSGLESFIDLCSNQKLDKQLVRQAASIKDWSVVNTLLYTSLKQTFTPYFAFQERRRKKDDTYITGGFVEKDLQYYDGGYQPRAQQLTFRDYQKQAFEHALRYLTDHDVNVLLVFAPVTKPAYEAYLNRGAINSYFFEQVKQYGLSGFLNYNETGVNGLTEHDHFYDEYHLNQSGVTLYNRALLHDMARLGILGLKK
jgi:hypothetical protein